MCAFALPNPFKVAILAAQKSQMAFGPMSDADAIPVIDLGPYLADEPGALDRAAAELRHALIEIGFYTIVNHGVPSALVHKIYRQVARFHARPLDEKLRIKLDKHNVGYLPMMGDTLRTSVVANVTKPNMSEAFFMARDLVSDHPTSSLAGVSGAPISGPTACPASANRSSNIATHWTGWCNAWCAFMPARSTCPPHTSMGRSPTSSTSCARPTTLPRQRRRTTNSA